MQGIIERCCGLDVHQETVVACVLIGAPGERPRKEIRTFRTMTRDLEALRDWAQELGVTQVGMESTGVYWRPVDAVLEGRFDLIVLHVVLLLARLDRGGRPHAISARTCSIFFAAISTPISGKWA